MLINSVNFIEKQQKRMPQLFSDADNKNLTSTNFQETQLRHILNIIAKYSYFIHLAISFIYTVQLLIFLPSQAKKRITMVFIIIYGFMLVWVLLVSFFGAVFKKLVFANRFNRLVPKILICLFPIFFALDVGVSDPLFFYRPIQTFMIYHLLFSILFSLYEIYGCTCGHHNYPMMVNEPVDYDSHAQEVRNRFEQHKQWKLKKKNSK